MNSQLPKKHVYNINKKHGAKWNNWNNNINQTNQFKKKHPPFSPISQAGRSKAGTAISGLGPGVAEGAESGRRMAEIWKIKWNYVELDLELGYVWRDFCQILWFCQIWLFFYVFLSVGSFRSIRLTPCYVVNLMA